MTREPKEPTARRAVAVPDDAPPPFLGTWRNLYALVIAVLVVVIVLLWAFSRAFA